MSTQNGPSAADDARIDEELAQLKQELADSMLDVLAPLRARLARIELLIVQRDRELSELRKMRTQTQRVLSAADPQTKPGPKPKSQKANVRPEKIDAVEQWLRDNLNGKEFSVASLNLGEHGDFDVVPEGTLAFVVKALADQGRIRLDSIGNQGRKQYKLVSP